MTHWISQQFDLTGAVLSNKKSTNAKSRIDQVSTEVAQSVGGVCPDQFLCFMWVTNQEESHVDENEIQ